MTRSTLWGSNNVLLAAWGISWLLAAAATAGAVHVFRSDMKGARRG